RFGRRAGPLPLGIGREPRPFRVDLLPAPPTAPPEDAPPIRIPADVEATATPGDAAPRLRLELSLGIPPVLAALTIAVLGRHELVVVPEATGEEADLAVHVLADARRRRAGRVGSIGAVGDLRVRVDEDDLRRERLPIHEIRVHELALRAEDDVEGAGGWG